MDEIKSFIECPAANALHAVGDSDRKHCTAITERIFINTRHTI